MKKIDTTKKMEQATVVTHGGIFHGDEVFGTVILSKIMDEVTVLRTFKVPEGLAEDVIVYDVGLGRFDHHQKGGNGARENGVPYAACGLLWKEFGPRICADTANPEMVWSIVDRNLIQGIDAVDNGAYEASAYPAQPWTVSKAVSAFNPRWDEKVDRDEKFLQAVAFAEGIFDNVFASAKSTAAAQAVVDEAMKTAEGHILILDQFVPWQDCLFTAADQAKADGIQFVVFPSERGGYNWQCVPDEPGSFGQRKPVPKSWCGLSGQALKDASGIATATFCHNTGFLGAVDTLEDCVAMAKLAVEA